MQNGNYTVSEFLLRHTKCYELCVIRQGGWIVATAWIDDEDLFIGAMDSKLLQKYVFDDSWGTLHTTDAQGYGQLISVHYIDIQ